MFLCRCNSPSTTQTSQTTVRNIFPGFFCIMHSKQVLNWWYFVSVEGLQCYSCDRNDIFSGLDTCGDVTITTDQNTKTCSDDFCMRVSTTMGNSAQPSQKMNCPEVIEIMLGTFGFRAQGFCGIMGSGCHPLENTGLMQMNSIEICCCTENL